jgi:DNA-binding protein H-NS
MGMARINLNKMSYAELLALQERVEDALIKRRAAEAEEVKEKLEALAQRSGFSLTDFVNGKQRRSKTKAAIKYRNPKDPSQTWSGRGRKPLWLVEAIKKGAKQESFAV